MIRRALTENWALKVFSLLLAGAIFVAVRNEQELTTAVPVRLSVQEPDDLINTADVPPEAVVRLSGSWGTIRAFSPESLGPIEIDLAPLQRGVSTVRIAEEQLRLPPEIKLISITPSVLTVRLETRERRVLPVKAALRGDPAKGHVVTSVVVDPPEVEVEGPRRELRDAGPVRTAPLEIAGAKDTLEADLALDPPGQHTRIPGPVLRATVRVEVEPRQVQRVVRIPVEGIAGAQPVQATLQGPELVLEALDAAALRAVVAGEVRPGRPPPPVRIEGLPPGVELLEPPALPEKPRG